MGNQNKNKMIQEKATFKKGINEKLIRSKEVRDTLDQNTWTIRT